MARVVTLPPQADQQSDGTVLGGWWHESDSNRIVCDLCPRECSLKPGDRGFCFVRQNRDGQMVLDTYGRSTGFCIDPIEKKPLNHFFPGTSVLSFGTAGCNLGCKFCQNWSISKSREVQQLSESATPQTIAHAARQLDCHSVAFTYNDPVIWAEYAIDVAKACHDEDVKTVAVTAGYIQPVARGPFFEHMDAANVDLKAFTEEFYQQLTLSHLQPVLDTLKWLKDETDVWIEVTNLIIPRANDANDEFQRMCDWMLQALGDEVPLHFTAFHPDFRLRDRERTPVESLLVAYEIARKSGIKYVYVGNVYDVAHQSTYCANCNKLVIQRDWHELGAYHLRENKCGFCGSVVAGRFQAAPGDWGRKRLPVRISEYASAEKQPSQLTQIEGHNMPEQSQVEPQSENGNQPNLSKEQQQAALRVVSELVRDAVTNRKTESTDPTIGGAADTPIFGCFVSIKRKGKLRGCCGFLGRRTGLLAALRESAAMSATADARLPSVSPTELPYLDFEIWLLHSQRGVTGRGEDRIGEVEVGRHGLQVQRGNARGLLLPGVATDHGLDAEGFLQQVCIKAGLPPTAWKEEDVTLATFEGLAVSGPFDHQALSESVGPRLMFREDEIAELTEFCKTNVLAGASGAVATYYTGCSDGSVHGISVVVHCDGRLEPLHIARMNIRRPMPLQSSLYQVCETIGQQLRLEGFGNCSAQQVGVELGVLYDPAMHGTVEEPDLDGVDARYHALLVNQNPNSAWVFDPGLSPRQLLEKAASQAKVSMLDSAFITSFVAQCSKVPMSVVSIPRPVTGPAERRPAVAGTFYPADPGQLESTINELMPKESVATKAWRAALVPHAGLVFSGRIAGDVLRRIEFPETVIVIGPKHTSLGVEWAVAPHQTWLLPGIQLASDTELAQKLCETIDGLEMDAMAHDREHAIEVELPFIWRLAPKSKVVGIAIGNGNLRRMQEFAAGLASVIGDNIDKTLLVISSDMNHFASDRETRRVDQMAIDAMQQLNPELLYSTVRDNHISMCGVLPACIVLDCLRRLDKLKTAEQVAYGTSADVSGDKSRVVGYAGMLFS